MMSERRRTERCDSRSSVCGDVRQHALREAAADHRGDLHQAARLRGEPVDAGQQQALERGGEARAR